MLSILKNKENVATQILHQFDVDYETYKIRTRQYAG